MTDKEIISLYFKRDENAIQETSTQYGKKLYSLSYKVVYDSGTAEECVNDTYLKAWNKIPPDNPVTFLYPYLAKITRGLSIDRYRHMHAAKRGANIVTLTDEIDDIFVNQHQEDMMVDKLVLKDSINKFLGELTKEQRGVFLRRYWYMDSISEIAEFYGFSQSKVKSMLMRIRNRLKEHLIKDGIF
ncbi:MAG: RNA polymerase sigma factor [Lachnospiraceae bacterium]|nr:RNA polymerase sigma factor [Lachnospiraceae bacterium]